MKWIIMNYAALDYLIILIIWFNLLFQLKTMDHFESLISYGVEW